MKSYSFNHYIFITIFLYLVLLGYYYYETQEYAIAQAKSKTEELLRQHQATRKFNIENQKKVFMKYQKEGIIDKDVFIPHIHSCTFATKVINSYYNDVRKKEGLEPIEISFASINARAPKNQASKEEEKIIKQLNNGEIKKYSKIIDTPKGSFLYFALPTQKNNTKCLKCHGKPQDAPKGLIAKYDSKNGFYEKTDYMRAVMKITVPLNEEFKYSNKLFIYLSLITLFILALILFIVKKFVDRSNKEANKFQALLDNQASMALLTDGHKLISANKVLLEFFPEYKNIEEFVNKIECICDKFIDMNNDNYLVKKDYDGQNWKDYVLSNPQKEFKAAMYKKNKLYHFSVKITKVYLDENETLIITLNDITKVIESKRMLEEVNTNLESIVKKKTEELQEVNDNLEVKIQQEVEKNRKKDEILYQQSKMASMGEMIGNIAHQWRQPLNALGLVLQNIQFSHQMGELNDEYLEKSTEKGKKLINSMSKTIDDFRNFFKPDKIKEDFSISQVISNTIDLIDGAYKNNNIKLILDLDENLKMNGYPSEFSQVLLNLLSNAKDVLVENKIEDAKVIISSFLKDNYIIISIKDNAGGVSEEIKEKIFDPYFTTKDEGKGTGIGLYMSKTIIEDNMGGKLMVYNDDDGALFAIVFPMVSE